MDGREVGEDGKLRNVVVKGGEGGHGLGYGASLRARMWERQYIRGFGGVDYTYEVEEMASGAGSRGSCRRWAASLRSERDRSVRSITRLGQGTLFG